MPSYPLSFNASIDNETSGTFGIRRILHGVLNLDPAPTGATREILIPLADQDAYPYDETPDLYLSWARPVNPADNASFALTGFGHGQDSGNPSVRLTYTSYASAAIPVRYCVFWTGQDVEVNQLIVSD
jgi:hypothetical protein